MLIKFDIFSISEKSESSENLEMSISSKKPRCYFIRRADQLIQEDKDDVIPYCIAIGDVKKLVHFFMSRGQLKEALLVAQAKTHNLHGAAQLWGQVWEGWSCSRD